MVGLPHERRPCSAYFAITCSKCERKRVRVGCKGPCHCTETCPECDQPVFLPPDTYWVIHAVLAGHSKKESLTNEEVFALVRRQMGYEEP
jgi:hypothetical protein